MGGIITGTGSAMPRQIIKNDYFSKNVFYTKDGMQNPKSGTEVIKKLEEISGIKERRFIGKEEESVDILFDASKKALENSGIDKNELEITNHQCIAYDILFGCPGWLQGVIQANRLIASGEAKHVSYCASFRISARMGVSPDSSSDHMGFRTVVTPKMLELKSASDFK